MLNQTSTTALLIIKNWMFQQMLNLGCLALRSFVKFGEPHFVTNRANVPLILEYLKEHTLAQFTQLIDICVYDNPGKSNRFTINYLILSPRYNTRAVVLTKTNELAPLFSVTKLFQSAFWTEREIWDLYGIFFVNHTDLRRILTDYNFVGHPLRKDFPLSGYVDLFYDDNKKHIVYAPIELTQEYRNFNFKSPWA